MTVTIRQATIDDLMALTPLFDSYRQFYDQPSDLDLARRFLRDRFAHAESIIFIAQGDDGGALGFTQLYPSFSSTRAARIYVLNDLYVAPVGRRRGVGAGLMAAAAAYGRAVGAVSLGLSTATTNLTAQSLYAAQGWTREASFFDYELALT